MPTPERISPEPAAGAPEGGALLPGAGHDLRSHLNTVVGTTLLLLETPLDPEQRSYALSLLAGERILAAAVDDLLDAARIDAGTLRLEEAPFDPEGLVRECTESVAGLAADPPFEFELQADPALPPTLSADGARLRRVLLHVLEAAGRSAAGATVPIRISAVSRDGAAVELRIAVGADLTQEERRTAGARRPSGSAAFRDVARTICERMAGALLAHEPGGAPAGFEVSLSAHAAGATNGSPAAAPTLARGRGTRVLVAEDDPLQRTILTRMLDRLGCRAECAADGREALDAATRSDHDLVLLDLRMPGMDGVETARAIRASGLRRAACVIGMTSAPTDADREACREAGMSALLPKPVGEDALERVLAGLAARAEEPRSAAFVDSSVLERLRGLGRSLGDGALFDRLVGLFAAEAPVTIARLRECAVRGDHDGVARTAHQLQGISAAIGATALAELAAEAPDSLRRDGEGGVFGVLGRMDAAWTRTLDALDAARR